MPDEYTGLVSLTRLQYFDRQISTWSTWKTEETDIIIYLNVFKKTYYKNKKITKHEGLFL